MIWFICGLVLACILIFLVYQHDEYSGIYRDDNHSDWNEEDDE